LDWHVVNDAKLIRKGEQQKDAMTAAMLDTVQKCKDLGGVLGNHVAGRLMNEFPNATRAQIIQVLELKGYELRRVPNLRRDVSGPQDTIDIKGQPHQFTNQPLTPEQKEQREELKKNDPDRTPSVTRRPKQLQ